MITSSALLPVRVAVDRDAAAVVDDLEAAVGVDRHVDPGGQVGHRLVDAVVDDLPDELVEAARIGRADVHARALADRLEALEDLDVGGGVARCGLGARLRCAFWAVMSRSASCSAGSRCIALVGRRRPRRG